VVDFTARPFDDLSTEELYELLQLRSEVFVVEQQCPYQDLDGFDADGWHLTGREEGELVAYARWYVDEEGWVRLGRIAVRRQWRRQGLAQQAVLCALAVIGQRPVKIHAQSYLRAFYERLGFAVVGEEFMEDGIPHLEMQLHPALG
jgi:ElaA protein